MTKLKFLNQELWRCDLLLFVAMITTADILRRAPSLQYKITHNNQMACIDGPSCL
jgi:hypothetical protein